MSLAEERLDAIRKLLQLTECRCTARCKEISMRGAPFCVYREIVLIVFDDDFDPSKYDPAELLKIKLDRR